MRSLFLKIFLWFWLAMILVTGAHVAFDQWNRHQHGPSHRRAVFGNIVTLYGTWALERWEHGGAPALRAYCDQLRQATDMHPMLLDEQGSELAGQSLTAGAQALATRVLDSGGVQVEHTETGLLVGARISGSDDQHYAMVAEIARSPLSDLFSVPITWVWRLGAVTIIGGFVCYWLARYLTAPIRHLRAATRQLARGDLAARVGAHGSRRRDEIGDLGRDFDYMAERVEALVLAQRRLLQDISHELRSPLARLSVALGLARQTATPQTDQALDRIERESERLGDLIGQLLTLTRLESGAEPGESVPIPLAPLVHEIADDADFEAASRNRHVRVVAAHEGTAVGSPELLRRAIENVVRNAVRYTPDGTDVEVALRCDGGAPPWAVIEVRDHGPGVPETALEDIFRPFYRVGDARDRHSGGTGLGLAITAQAIRLHSGTVSAANAPDGGLLVCLRIPLVQNGTDSDPAPTAGA